MQLFDIGKVVDKGIIELFERSANPKLGERIAVWPSDDRAKNITKLTTRFTISTKAGIASAMLTKPLMVEAVLAGSLARFERMFQEFVVQIFEAEATGKGFRTEYWTFMNDAAQKLYFKRELEKLIERQAFDIDDVTNSMLIKFRKRQAELQFDGVMISIQRTVRFERKCYKRQNPRFTSGLIINVHDIEDYEDEDKHDDPGPADDDGAETA